MAMPARAVEPCDSDAVTLLQVRDTRTECGYNTSAFMTGYERKCRFDWPITVGRVQIRVAHSGGADFHERLPRSGCGDWHFSNH
jgi:hypothetical protein